MLKLSEAGQYLHNTESVNCYHCSVRPRASFSSPLVTSPTSLQSKFYTLLTLPFPDQPRLARRDLTTFASKAGAFSSSSSSSASSNHLNPSKPVLARRSVMASRGLF